MLPEVVRHLDVEAQRFLSPCGDGDLVIRRWQGPQGGANVLLVHGGSGSFSHWVLNIEPLRRHFTVYAVDLPGLGDSGTLPSGYTAADAVAVVDEGLSRLEVTTPWHIVAFSWGCAVSSQLVARDTQPVASLLLVGPASLGDIPRRGGMKPLLKRNPAMSETEIHAANRENLSRLMFADRRRIDELAVAVQTSNTDRARFNSPQFSRTRLTLDGVAASRVPLKVMYGADDAPAKPDVAGKQALFAAVRPDHSFHVEPDCGHWLQYEKPAVFYQHVTDWIQQHE